MSRKWTPEQENAINSTGGSILVSAAAGSGKTSVLVERVIKQITDLDNPIDIDKFLIVTFTKAAAQEMRNRISARLSEMISKNPQNSHLHNQQIMLKCASLGTIHSFCASIIRENFYKLGISPKFRIAEESEISIIKNQAMEKTLNDFYEFQNPDFIYTANLFGNEKNDNSLSLIIEQIYDFTRSLPFPKKWMNNVCKMYENITPVKDSPWGKIAVNFAKKSFTEVQKILSQIKTVSSKNENIQKSYGEAIEKDLSEANSIMESLNIESWDKIAEKITQFSFSKFKPLRCKDCDFEKNVISEKRKYAKNLIENSKKYFTFSELGTINSLKKFKVVTKTLFEVTNYFCEEISYLKTIKNIADYSDLEHWTIKLLSKDTDSGEINPSDIAFEISNRYAEIMVDEYQDINEIQNTIFKLINNNNKMFCVGDVKQSIYKFRHSKPQIFLGKKSDYRLYSKEENNYPAKIILGKNFRSNPKIIDSINFIFESIMSEEAGEIQYNDEEKLVPGIYKEETQNDECDINFSIIDTSQSQENSDILEADFIAEKITEMIHQKYKVIENGTERPITYSDFCILMRSSNAHAHIYASRLLEQGIPAWSETKEKFLDTSEISNIISILQTINNPVQDIPLISAMMSPIFGFNVDELSEIRESDRNNLFYFAVKKSSENGIKKCTDFLEKINYWRKISCTVPCGELIEFIYQDTDYPALCLAKAKGEVKKANLELLIQYAEKFENQYHKGLSGFLDYIENIRQKKSDLEPASISSEYENTVKIMSIHKSKGLEFPVCIVSGCGKKFNFDKNKVIINSDFGPAMKLKNDEGTLQFDNLMRKAVFSQNQNEDISEEMRIFYVALTRAKQKLFLIASIKEPTKIIEKSLILTQGTDNISPFEVKNSSSFASWIILCICQSTLRNKLCNIMNLNEYISEKNSKHLNWDINLISPEPECSETLDNYEECAETQNSVENFDAAWRQIINDRFDFVYPYKEFINLPLKISASMMNQSGDWEQYTANSKPSFASEKNFTPAQKGTALHKFMCFANFKRATLNGVKSEINYLLSEEFLTVKESESLNVTQIQKFINSPLAKRILQSKKVLREQRFSVKIPPELLNKHAISEKISDTFVVMQGALDCAFQENGKYVIVDYKTDKTENIKDLYEKYSTQLNLYKYALEKISEIKVKELIIYSFYLNESFSKTI